MLYDVLDDLMRPDLVIFLLFVILYAAVAVWLSQRSITMPMFFLALGALTGAHGLGWINISITSEEVKTLVEVTLALLLFADSSTLKLHQLQKDAGLPARLLGLGLPMIIFLGGMLVFLLFPGRDWLCPAHWCHPGADRCRPGAAHLDNERVPFASAGP